jgi:predicted membrane channel-forming protein YqfA (hemolysin III family)
MDLPQLIVRKFEIDLKQRAAISIFFGLNMLIIAWYLDQITILDWSFWLYFFGGLSFTCGLIWYLFEEVNKTFCFNFSLSLSLSLSHFFDFSLD